MRTFTLTVALLVAPAAYAQTKTETTTETKTERKTETTTTTATDRKPPAKAGKLSKSELQAVAHYHELNKLEIDLGKVAIKNGKSEGVKEYGRMLVAEHGDSNKKFKALAKKRGQVIPMEKPATEIEKQDKADAKKAAAKLEKLKGAEFDAAFLTQMVMDHEKELAKIDTKAAGVQDAELADMIRAQKPVLQHHADRARELQKGTSGQVSSSAGPGTGTTGAGTVTSGSTSTTTSGTSPPTTPGTSPSTQGTTGTQARRPAQK